MPEGKPIAQDQKSEVSQEGTPFSRSNYPQKHHRALAGILLLTESKAGHFANVREATYDLERPRISRALHTCLSST